MKSRSLVLLSGEPTSLPEAEARALFLAYDGTSTFESPEKGVLVASSSADPLKVARRIAYARRVGTLVGSLWAAEAAVRGGTVRLKTFCLPGSGPPPDPVEYLKGLDLKVDLKDPGFEITLVRGRRDYLAVTVPRIMQQEWSLRRPRRRPFFHPSAVFPKLSRALVNLSRCLEGDVFLDPFAGTGSLAIEAEVVGARVLAWDQAKKMAYGALSNMRHFGQSWMGVLRADALHPPARNVNAVSTDVPYGRASSTKGRSPEVLARGAISSLSPILSPGSRIVMMHPQSMAIPDLPGVVVEEEHHLHVHKLLTRTITVMLRQ